ncbi:RDD family protein [Kitasatospora sp. NPDC057015]|uniref:RDD family protein n=1 Tax=Kitasatospora sp. NPDC057015 TaxID=3346001 RepID=UPI00362A1E47
MAQGYPQGSYGQGPYPQPPAGPYGQQPGPYGGQENPYAQQPAQHPHPRQLYPRHPQNPQPYPQQPHPPAPHRPYPPQPLGSRPYGGPQAPGAPLPPAPVEAGDGLRILAAVLDGSFAAVAGFAAAKASMQHGGAAGGYFGLLFAVVIGFGFANQVVLARLTGFSLGKGLLALRVIRYKDVSRPGTWRLTRRWLLGYVLVPIGLMLDELEPEEACGVRVVRRRRLDEWRRGAGRLG